MTQLFNIPYLISTYGYLGIFIIVFLESGIFFALPGDSLLFSVGILSAGGFLSIYKVIPIIFVSTFLGALAGYQVGIHIEKLKKYSMFRKMLHDKHLKNAEIFFNKHGKLTIIISRFVPIVRTFVPIVAGLVKMKYRKFIEFSLIGSLLWSFIVPLVGYFVGILLPQASRYLSVLVGLVVVLSILPIVYEIIKKKINNRRIKA